MNTTHLLQTSIVALVAGMPRPTGLVVNWFADFYSVCISFQIPPTAESFRQDKHDHRGSQYVGLMRNVYELINSSTSLPLLTSGLLRIIFVNLQGDALSFLAGVWTVIETVEDDALQTVALRHATAFLQAHLVDNEAVDFQTILPTLLVALESPNVHKRQAALGALSILHKLAETRFSSVYAFDVVYGESEREVYNLCRVSVSDSSLSGELQYLTQDDFKRYLGALMEHQEHFAHDPGFFKVFQYQHLAGSKSDKKKDMEYVSSPSPRFFTSSKC